MYTPDILTFGSGLQLSEADQKELLNVCHALKAITCGEKGDLPPTLRSWTHAFCLA